MSGFPARSGRKSHRPTPIPPPPVAGYRPLPGPPPFNFAIELNGRVLFEGERARPLQRGVRIHSAFQFAFKIERQRAMVG